MWTDLYKHQSGKRFVDFLIWKGGDANIGLFFCVFWVASIVVWISKPAFVFISELIKWSNCRTISVTLYGARWRTMLQEEKNGSSCLWCYASMKLIGLTFGHNPLTLSKSLIFYAINSCSAAKFWRYYSISFLTSWLLLSFHLKGKYISV